MQGKTTRAFTIIALALAAAAACAEEDAAPTEVVVSVAEQRLVVLRDGMWIEKHKVSTSKFGIGDSYGSYKTPIGKLRVCEKIGESLPCGSVIKHRNATGEVLPVNAPGRDPIVTRIIWLDGLEERNKNAKSRGIYIHGTVEEAKIGEAVSYGCIRMRSREVMELFENLPIGTLVSIQEEKLPHYRRWTPPAPPAPEIVVAKATPPKPAATATIEPAAKPAASAPLVASHALEKPDEIAIARPRIDAAQEPVEAKPRVASIETIGLKPARMIPADPGAALALKGSILFADLPGYAAKPRTASSLEAVRGPRLEPVAEGPRGGADAWPNGPAPTPQVSSRTGHAESARQTVAQSTP
jgi:L,D-transpeptidase catalytic domain